MGRRRAGAYLGVLIIAGSLTSLVAEYLLCQWPAAHSHSLAAAFLVATCLRLCRRSVRLSGHLVFLGSLPDEPFIFLEPLRAQQRSRLDLDTFRCSAVPAALNRRSFGRGNGGRAHGDWSAKSSDAGCCYSSSGWLENGRPGAVHAIPSNAFPGGTCLLHCTLHLWRVLRPAQTCFPCR